MPPQPPWTDTGRLQQEISDVRRQINQKAGSHEIYAINNRLNSLEQTIANINSQIRDLLYRIQTLESLV
jgi:predicted  nucleic acid-binding Zn-ribbon protein